MTRFACIVFLAACTHAAPPPAGAPKPAPPANPPAVQSASPEVLVWTRYQDYRAHGFKGSGRGYRSEGGRWLVADCRVSHVADPEAGPQAGVQCDAWTEVPEAQWPTLDGLPKHGVDITCGDKPDVCTALGLHEDNPRVP